MRVTEEMKRKYLSRRMDEIGRIRGQLASNDFSLAQTVGHQIKGNAKTFEFPEIAEIGVEMEQAAKKQDRMNLNLCLGHLDAFLNQNRGIFGQQGQ